MWARLCGLLVFAAILHAPRAAHAYAWMLQHGYTGCPTCHADPSGGELLTPYGRVTADLLLRMNYGSPPDDSKPPSPGVLWGAWEPPEGLLLSGSYRNLYVIRPEATGEEFKIAPVMQADLYGQLDLGGFLLGGSIGLSKVPVGSLNARAAQVTTGQEDQVNMIARNYYAGYRFGQSGWLRAGRLNLPFGIRVPEHTMWVREATRTDRESDQQHGLAFAYLGEHMRAEVMGIAGNYQLGPDDVRERGYSAFVEGLAFSKVAAGISSKVTYAAWDRLTFERDSIRQAHGLTLRAAPWSNFTILGEVDALFRTNADAGYVGFAQANYEVVRGLHILLTGEVLDEGAAIGAPISPGHGDPRFGGWLSFDWFFFKQFEFRTDAVARSNDPFTILGQLHLYL
ncbi:MAG TPA: hypothetical protein VLC09_15895 [Polyangiaceae bacterium]|nr:hypothetical protein [Polyangiaceae bacterium]